MCLTKGEQRRAGRPQNTAAFPQPLSCACRASTYMTCSSVYALPCFGFELVTIIACARTQQQHMHPPQQQTDRQTDRQQQHSSLPRARSVRAREYSDVIIESVRVAGQRRSPRRDWRAHSSRHRRPRRVRPEGMGAGPASLSFPTGRPGAGSLRRPLALGRRSGVSAKTSREGVF